MHKNNFNILEIFTNFYLFDQDFTNHLKVWESGVNLMENPTNLKYSISIELYTPYCSSLNFSKFSKNVFINIIPL